MKKNLFIIILCFISIICISAQQTDATKQPDANSITAANSQITEVRLSGFEDASFWEASMPIDQGIAQKQSRRGAPVEVVNDESTGAIKKRDEKYGIPRNYDKDKVLGVKVQYIARGYNWFAVRPVKPIVIEGICQNISVYIAGRNYKHVLKILILDYFNRERMLYVDKLNFIGWKDLVVSIPDFVEQTDYHFTEKQGIKFNGFLIECDPMESYGSYYIYFDELRAMTDVFNEKTRDLDDMRDDW